MKIYIVVACLCKQVGESYDGLWDDRMKMCDFCLFTRQGARAMVVCVIFFLKARHRGHGWRVGEKE